MPPPDARCGATPLAAYMSWDAFTLLARGLVLHERTRQVVATPFPKFFNLGERGQVIPELHFEVFEKLDGSLIIIHFHESQWRVATKGAFDSSQALWAEARLAQQDLLALQPGTTYLAEAIYLKNRIVIIYAEPALVLLAAYDADGLELSTAALQAVAAGLGWRLAERYHYDSFASLVAEAHQLPASREGFVIRFANGLRLKAKGTEYRRIHALISHCTPLVLWEAWAAGDDLNAIRRELPEEFWSDFDGITALLQQAIAAFTARIAQAAANISSLDDKALGLCLTEQPEATRSFLFPWRKSGGNLTGKDREAFFRAIRPAGNNPDGYTPSYALKRVAEDS